jgi:hypothetical protein
MDEFMQEWDELVYQEADRLGLDPDIDEDYPADLDMPSVAIGEAIKSSIAYEQLERTHASALIKENLAEAAHLKTFNESVKDSGLEGQMISFPTEDGKEEISSSLLELAGRYMPTAGSMLSHLLTRMATRQPNF